MIAVELLASRSAWAWPRRKDPLTSHLESASFTSHLQVPPLLRGVVSQLHDLAGRDQHGRYSQRRWDTHNGGRGGKRVASTELEMCAAEIHSKVRVGVNDCCHYAHIFTVLASTFLLYSVGLGAGAIPAAGALNWVLKVWMYGSSMCG